MNERLSLLAAGVAHLALFAALSLSWQKMQMPPPFVEAVPVEVIDVADLPAVTELPKPSMAAAPQETVEAQAPEPAPDEAKAEPLPQPQEPVAPTPVPDPKKQAEPPKPKPEPAATPAKKKAPVRLDASELSSLIDKSLPKAKRKPLDTSALANSIEQAIPKGARLDARAAATLEQAIRAQITPCWNPPVGAEDAGKMTVVLKIRMRKDGSVIGLPDIVSQTGLSARNGAYGRAFADSARRAVVRCAPLKLPVDLYEAWAEFELNFDPSQMN